MRLTCCSAKLATLLIVTLLVPSPLYAQSRQQRPHRPESRPGQQPQTGIEQISTALNELLKQAPLQPNLAAGETNAATDKDDAKRAGKPPADDAPIKELISYWRSHAPQEFPPGKDKPSDAVRERLLAACEDRPHLLLGLINVLPQSSDAYDRVYKLVTECADENVVWKSAASRWLQFNSSYFRESLVENAHQLVQRGAVDISSLNALAQLDWDAAKPLVQSLANSTNTFQAARAVAIIYEHASRSGDASQVEQLRAQLQAMVGNRQTPAPIRQDAFQSLMTTEWNGQEDWYVSLFNDTSLSGARLEEKQSDKGEKSSDDKNNRGFSMFDDRGGFNFLWMPLQGNTARWLPVVLRLVGNENRAVHLAAVSSLAGFLGANAGSDEQSVQAARALLPWLTDARWGGELERWSYIGSLSKMDLPEALPGLIWILDNDEEPECRALAAEALIRYKNPQAIQPLRRALNRETDEQLREALIGAIIQLSGFSDDEAVIAIEAYARKITTPEGQKEIADASGGDSNKTLPLPVSIGRVYAQREEIEIGESLAAKLFARAKALRPTLPEVARQILSIAETADLMIADLNLAERIGEGRIDVEALKLALESRAAMRKRISDEVSNLIKQGGYAAGVAAILLDDESNRREILKGKDQNAQLALLAAARYTMEKLPVDLVNRLFATPSLAIPAESYLEVEDSAEARKIVWARHPGEAKILGERLAPIAVDGPPAGLTHSSHWEEIARDEVRGKGGAPTAEEIYAIAPTYIPGLSGIIIRVRHGEGEISLQYEEGRRRVRRLSAPELQNLKEFTSGEELQNIGPLERGTFGELENGMLYFVYLRVTKDGGRRILIPAPAPTPKKDATPREQLAGLFYQLSHSGEYTLRYTMEDKIPGLEVLLADDTRRVFTACHQEAPSRQIVVMVEPEGKNSPGLNPIPRDTTSFEWRTLSGRQLGAPVDAPRSCQIFNLMLAPQEWQAEVRQRYGVMMDSRARLGEAWIAPAVIEGESGLWKFEENKSPVRIAEGTYVNIVVTPDGKWIVAKKILQSSDKYEAQITRIRLQAGRVAAEFPVTAAPLSGHYPLTFIPAHNKVLLGQGHFQYGSEFNSGTYYLLDAETGAVQQVKGEFRPLQDQFARALQSTEKPNEFWAAIYNPQKKVTGIGRYDARTFTFAPVVEVPEIRVSNANIWVDATAGKIYLAYLGHLLRLPLTK